MCHDPHTTILLWFHTGPLHYNLHLYFPRYILTSDTHVSYNNVQFNYYGILFLRTDVKLNISKQNQHQSSVSNPDFDFARKSRFSILNEEMLHQYH